MDFKRIKEDFKNKGFKLEIDGKRGFKFFKQTGTKKHNCEILFYPTYKELKERYKKDLNLKNEI